MSRHSIAEAQARLPELIARAAAGEEVVIANDDGPAVVLSMVTRQEALPPFPAEPGPAREAWFRQVRVGSAPSDQDSAALVRELRDSGY